MKRYLIPFVLTLFAAQSFYACGSDDSGKDNEKSQPNGSACAMPEDCASGYCNANALCADKPRENIANGDACSKSDECKSNYCNENSVCADKPRDNIANGDACSKSEECMSNYCNENSVCAEPPSNDGANGEACLSGASCTSGYCTTEGTCADKPVINTDHIALQDVPADQVNKAGEPCDPAKFVEHCNGNALVWCERDEKGNYTVHADTCDSDRPQCGLSLLNGSNHVVCYGSGDACSAGAKDDVYCDTDEYGYAISINYSCVQFEDGSYNYSYSGIKYCAGKCTKTSCVEETCDPLAGHKCTEDGNNTLECFELNDGRYVYHSFNCSSDGTAVPQKCGFIVGSEPISC